VTYDFIAALAVVGSWIGTLELLNLECAVTLWLLQVEEHWPESLIKLIYYAQTYLKFICISNNNQKMRSFFPIKLEVSTLFNLGKVSF